MKNMENHIFSKVYSIDNAQNGLKHTSNDTYSNTHSSNAYILGWFMRSAYFWLFFGFFGQNLSYFCKVKRSRE